MKLFEIIPGPQTKPEHIEAMAEFAEKRLGKGIVFAKDTPNFIGNRIGVFSGNLTNKLMVDYDFTIEQVDALTGPVIGRPKMATYRLGDLVGLDVMAHVASNVREAATDDERLEIFEPFPWVEEMIKKGWLGNKTGQGFYKKVKGEGGKKEIQVLDWKKLEYRPKQKAKFASLEAANQQSGTKDKLKSIYYATDEGGKFVFQLLSEIFIYSANRIPEISDDIVNIDNAMKWGYNWKLGPFESWDAVGVEKSAAKMKEAGYEIPAWVDKMLAAGAKSFYKMEAGVNYYWDVAAEAYQEVPISPQIILLPSLKDRDQVVASNQGASIVDLGDGVICVEFHTKMNALGPDIANMLHKACDLVEEGQFEGIVLANHGSNFSVGANLMLVLFTAQEEEWDELLFMVKGLQDTYMRLKYLSRPVVAAPHQMALGGGCEACLHADRVVAAAETYIGLVEVGVGVVPAGGGTKELLIRNTEERLFRVQKGGIYPKDVYLLPFVARAFETIAQAKVATSAKEAKKMGFLRDADKISLNSDYRIKMAKDNVLAMNLAGYEAPEPLQKIRVMGREAMGTIDYVLYNMHKAGWITPHDITVARKVGWVLTGGEVLPDSEVSEQYLLELEREAFVSLCGTKETQARMAHMLKTGKPLRN
jgi:3-hydroxyacyl-CoA dehydrogenase